MTATVTSEKQNPTLTCTVESDPSQPPLKTITFDDLIMFEENPGNDRFGTKSDALLPPKGPAKMTPKGAAPSPVISIHATPNLGSPAPSSSSSSSSRAIQEQSAILREICEELKQIRTVNQLKVDVLTAVNKNLENNSKILVALKEHVYKRARSRSRSPRKVSPKIMHSPRRYRRY